MARILIAIITLSIYLHASGTTPGRAAIDTLIHRLDKVMEQRDTYTKEKEKKIELLRQNARRATTDIDRFEAWGHLFDEYISFDTDSALYAATVREETARHLNDTPLIDNARLNMAMILSSTGNYKECLDILNQIPSKRIPSYLLPYYYHIHRSTYGAMADMALRPADRKKYTHLTDAYRDSLLMVNAHDSLYHTLIQADALNTAKQYRQSARLMHSYMDSHPLDNHLEAIFAYTLAQAYHGMQDPVSEKYYLLKSAIADLQSGHREYTAPQQLAMILYKEGDLNRAYQLMKIALDDASRSNSRQRIVEINEAFPIINAMYLEHQTLIQRRLRSSLIVIGALLILLLISAVYLIAQIRRVKRAHIALREVNTRLETINSALNAANTRLTEANRIIDEQSYLKTEYIGHYMSMSRQNIEALQAYRFHLRKLLVAGKTTEVIATLDSQKDIQTAFKAFFHEFDHTFLKLFPDFISELNQLLLPEYRLPERTNDDLTTELRVFALIRLGITDSNDIAKFLGTSISTVYNYRTRMRNRAAGNRDNFDTLVTMTCKQHKAPSS